MDVRIGKFRVRDGTQLHYEHWHLPDFRGTIVLVHGLSDHCGRYGPFVDFFTHHGYKVCLYDQRGHGRSEGRRVYVDNLETLIDDLEQYLRFCRQGVPPDLPWLAVGHSFGGEILIDFLARYPGLFKAACAESPNLKVALDIPEWKRDLARLALHVWPPFRLHNLSRAEMISHDGRIVEAYTKDPLVYPFVTAKMGDEILKDTARIFSLCGIIQTPLLLLHGSADAICDSKVTRRFYEQLPLAEKRLKIYEGMYHELFNEIQKEEVFADVDAWFKNYI